jgi:glycosyltransferase involved in cell wall biosynthesis
MSTKIKVAHILWSGGIGGTEEYVTSFIQFFDTAKYDVHLCFLAEKGQIFEEAVRKGKVTIDFICMKNGYDIIGCLKFYIYLLRGKFDIIHSHDANLLSTVPMALIRGPKKVLTEHVSPGWKTLFMERKLFYRLFFKTFSAVIAISGFVKRRLKETMDIDPEKIVVIHNGILIDKFSNINSPPDDLLRIKHDDKFIIGFTGRMEEFKRPELFIYIALELIKKNNNFCFVMVGDGPEFDKCRKIIHSHNVSEYFKLLGFRRDIAEILKLCNAFLFTSEGEGFGIVLLEAMAMGVPVFAMNSGAVPEILTHEKTGILFNTTDPVSIAEQIIKVIKNGQLMDEISKKGMKEVHDNYSIEVCVKRMEAVYEKVLSQP